MSARAGLIAGREFRTYVLTVSFWLSLALGPLLAAGGAFLIPAPPAPGSAASLVLSRGPDGHQVVRFDENVSEAAKREILRSLAQGAAARVAPPPVVAPSDGTLPRLLLVVGVWAVVTASTGMCLHALARERAGRTLEGLLALARPWEIVLGKLLGVTAVAVLVLAVWLVGGVAAIGLGSPSGSMPPLHLPTASAVVRMVLLVASAVALYGLVAIGVGGRARDISDAQNLSRPMFAVLLLAFFASLMSAVGGAGVLPWLGYAPPFAPFLLLLHPRPLVEEAAATALLVAGCAWAAAFAASSVRMGPAAQRGRTLHFIASRLRGSR